ncbi:MAG: sialidase family protein, partial [Ignavibacteria bacterium]
MQNKLLVPALLILLILASHSSYSQDSNDPRWNVDPRTVVNLSGDYKPLPIEETDIRQFTTEPQRTITPMGVMVTFPNIRVNPSNNFSQSEVVIVSNPVNRNILFGSSNAYTFSSGTINSGVYRSFDGGLTWTGVETFGAGSANNQRGDPGPTISKFGTWLFTHLTSATNFGGLTGMGANRSIDNGATWTNTFQVVNDVNADKNLTGTDDYPTSPFYGNSYFAYTSFGTNPANGRASRTINDGVSWSVPIIINATPAGHNAQGHDVATGPGGEVYIVWSAGVNFSPFTEDFMGVAKSVNGGVSYTATENAFNVNGSRSGSFNGWGIRTNGFPRIAVDKTGGARNGWIYVVSSEINNAPAGTDADVVFHRSINGGATWSGGIRVNQDALNNGKVQFFPAICVDADGGIDVVYYDNRQFPSVGDSCGVYISRSLDGGITWADVKISDHNFKPKQMSPFGGGYMGDYIGITASVGKVVALWMDDKANTVAIANAWAGALDITTVLPTICQDFSGAAFPPPDFTLEFTGTQEWTRETPSAYAAGSGSAKFDYWNAAAGVTQSLVTQTFAATAANTYLTYDRAYSPFFSNTDSLIIETSVNGG